MLLAWSYGITARFYFGLQLAIMAVMTASYWLHIIRNTGSRPGIPPTYIVARADRPTRKSDASMAAVHHPSWEHLCAALRAVGCEESELVRAKKHLDENGNYTVPGIQLDKEGLQTLGYKDV